MSAIHEELYEEVNNHHSAPIGGSYKNYALH